MDYSKSKAFSDNEYNYDIIDDLDNNIKKTTFKINLVDLTDMKGGATFKDVYTETEKEESDRKQRFKNNKLIIERNKRKILFDEMIDNSKKILKIINNKIKIDPGQYIDKRDIYELFYNKLNIDPGQYIDDPVYNKMTEITDLEGELSKEKDKKKSEILEKKIETLDNIIGDLKLRYIYINEILGIIYCVNDFIIEKTKEDKDFDFNVIEDIKKKINTEYIPIINDICQQLEEHIRSAFEYYEYFKMDLVMKNYILRINPEKPKCNIVKLLEYIARTNDEEDNEDDKINYNGIINLCKTCLLEELYNYDNDFTIGLLYYIHKFDDDGLVDMADDLLPSSNMIKYIIDTLYLGENDDELKSGIIEILESSKEDINDKKDATKKEVKEISDFFKKSTEYGFRYIINKHFSSSEATSVDPGDGILTTARV